MPTRKVEKAISHFLLLVIGPTPRDSEANQCVKLLVETILGPRMFAVLLEEILSTSQAMDRFESLLATS